MRVARALLQSINGVSRHFHRPPFARHFSAFPAADDRNDENRSTESLDDFEKRIFDDLSGGSPKDSAFFKRYDRMRQGESGQRLNDEDGGGIWQWLDKDDTMDDRMDEALRRKARYFEYNSEEVEQEDYSFRHDMNFQKGQTYDVKDLDLRRPGFYKPNEKPEFEVTTEEVLQKADFRNVRFLANFITEAGIIIKRSQTGIRAKAQRKVAREIKTARALGLMPFETMGTKSFVFNQSMQSADRDYEHEVYDDREDMDVDDVVEPRNRRGSGQ